MPSMSEVIGQHTDLSEAERQWLWLLVSEWQLFADLCFPTWCCGWPTAMRTSFGRRRRSGRTPVRQSLFDDVVG